MNSRKWLLRLCGLLLVCGDVANAEQLNPNKLSPCPPGSPVHWSNCFGTYLYGGNAYTGDWHGGMMNGFGNFTYANGSRYTGFILNGKYEGKGKYVDNLGNVYEGDWLSGEKHGKGQYTSTDRSMYSGDWIKGKQSGFGTQIYPDGSSYIGEWKEGKAHGLGMSKFSDGTIIEGVFQDHKFVESAKNNSSKLLESKNQNTTDTNKLSKGEKTFEDNSKENESAFDLFAIQPVYDDVDPFSEGLAAVRIGSMTSGKWGFIDKSGNIVIKPQFDAVYPFKQGLAPVRFGGKQGGKWGYINKNGSVVINPKFDSAFTFNENYALVGMGSNESIKYGYIDRSGSYVIHPKYDSASSFEDGLAAVRVGSFSNGKWGFIDKKGSLVIKPKYLQTHGFSEGLAPVSLGSWGKEEKWGFIDKKGNTFINFDYDHVLGNFSGGLAAVRVGDFTSGKMGLIDKSGNFVVPAKFDLIYPFIDDFAAVRIGDDKTGAWGAIDRSGNLVITPKYPNPVIFREGLAFVKLDKDKDGKVGYVNQNGQLVLAPQFTSSDQGPVRHFYESLAATCIVIKDFTKCGFISRNPEEALRISGRPTSKKNNPDIVREVFQYTAWVSFTSPDSNGAFTININTNTDTASLKINGEEQGGRVDGNYTIKRVARVGQDTQFTITAIDVYGNSDTKTITVTRQAAPAADTSIALKPEAIKRAPARDAVAIIIGIQDYKRVPKAEFANNDAKEFYEYAIRALGIKQEKIKMLLDDEADEVNIVKAFENWLPIQVNKDKTDVYVFYSGHGLPAPDGKSLYFLPHGVDKELLSRTAVGQNEIVAALSAAKPKSVTMFIDACYSGQTRGGDVLVANAKPVSLKSDTNAYPANFTVITASANDQISSSSPELKHGIFSFYLMKGMEGEADANKDGKITVGEMQYYLSDKVSRQAMTLNRKQTTQLVGDAGRVLVGR